MQPNEWKWQRKRNILSRFVFVCIHFVRHVWNTASNKKLCTYYGLMAVSKTRNILTDRPIHQQSVSLSSYTYIIYYIFAYVMYMQCRLTNVYVCAYAGDKAIWLQSTLWRLIFISSYHTYTHTTHIDLFICIYIDLHYIYMRWECINCEMREAWTTRE